MSEQEAKEKAVENLRAAIILLESVSNTTELQQSILAIIEKIKTYTNSSTNYVSVSKTGKKPSPGENYGFTDARKIIKDKIKKRNS